MTLKMVAIVFRESLGDELHALLKRCHIVAYTELQGALGAGGSGTALGTLLQPGQNSLLLTVVSDRQAQHLKDGFVATLEKLQEAQRGAEIPMKLFILPVEEQI
ncbi:hypothetical protein YTPLAS18_14460 [Nitrospira sp.]|nr:hypothetical protein YTPLAS18_14460 [Nitrospira sp.]